VSVALLGLAAAAAQVAGVVYLVQELGWTWAQALGATAVADGLAGCASGALALAVLRRPWLQDTRSVLEDTVKAWR
jgi:hypothetical protein